MPRKTPAPSVADLEPLLRRFATDRLDIERFYPAAFSEEGRARRRRFLDETEAGLAGLDWGALGPDARVDAHLLADFVRRQRALLELRERREAEIADWVPFAGKIVALEAARVRVEPLDPEAAAGVLDAVTASAKEALAAEREGATGVRAQRAAAATRDLREVMARWFAHHDGFKPLFAWWCRTPFGAARDALEALEKRYREELAGIKGGDDDPLVGDPVGREALVADLAAERIAWDPEELVAVARRELAWCEERMAEASREMGLGDDWRAALERVKAEHAPPGGQDDLVAAQAREAIAFVDARDLVEVEPLCRETWRVDMLDREGQKTLPFAAYGGQRMLVAYPLEGMDHATKGMSLRGNNIHFSRIVTPHELIPGHHLQKYMEDRHRAYRKPFSTPFFVEGWALHWEMLLWDLEYATGPQNRIGMLFWRMHRCARIVVSLAFHLGEMAPAQMVDFLVERVGHERFAATSEVRRYIGEVYPPLYQCAYMVGGLQMRALWRELEGRGWSPRRFHDAALREGAIPIDLLAARLLGRELERGSGPAGGAL